MTFCLVWGVGLLGLEGWRGGARAVQGKGRAGCDFVLGWGGGGGGVGVVQVQGCAGSDCMLRVAAGGSTFKKTV